MKNSRYWPKRQEQLWDQLEKDEEKLTAKLKAHYDKELVKLDKEIAAYYAKYGKDNVIAYNTLMQQLDPVNKTMLIERMDEFAQKFPEYAELMPVRESVYKLNRLQGLQQSVYVQQMELGVLDKQQLEEHLTKVYETGNKAAMEALGIGSSFQTVRKDVLEQTINARWVNEENFSERIWKDRKKLSAHINQEMGAAFARGDSYDRTAKRIKELYSDVSMRDIKRLIRTEGTHVMNQAMKQPFEDEFDEYQFSAVMDKNTSKICQSLQNKKFKFKDAVEGVNFPPMHPNCRSTFEVVIPDEDEEDTREENPPISVNINGAIYKKYTSLHGFSDGFGEKTWPKLSTSYKSPEGIKFIFPKGMDPQKQTMTPEKAAELFQKVPEKIRKRAPKIVEFVDYENPNDEFFRKRYKDFQGTYAASGKERITFFKYELPHKDYEVVRTYCHEIGHKIDREEAIKEKWFSREKEWTQAMKQDTIFSGVSSPTQYGENAAIEDFAESVAEYATNKEIFAKSFPARNRVLESLGL